MEDDPMIQAARGAVEAMQRLAEVFLQQAQPALVAFGQAAQQMHDWMWERYRDAGMPHGDSEDGMMLWFEQIAAAERLQQRMDEERAWAITMERIRQIGQARRASSA